MRKLLNVIVGGLLVSAGASAYANQVVLENGANHPNITVEYRLAYKNSGQPAILSGVNTTRLGSFTVDLPAKDGFQEVGVAVVSVNGVKLPNQLSGSDSKRGCFIFTDSLKTEASLQITYREHAGSHGSITCMGQ